MVIVLWKSRVGKHHMIENCTSENESYILIRVCDIMIHIDFGKGGTGNSHVKDTTEISERPQKWLATFRRTTHHGRSWSIHQLVSDPCKIQRISSRDWTSCCRRESEFENTRYGNGYLETNRPQQVTTGQFRRRRFPFLTGICH